MLRYFPYFSWRDPFWFNASWWILVEMFGAAWQASPESRGISSYFPLCYDQRSCSRKDLFLDRNSTPARITQSFYPVLNLRGGTELYISALYKPHVCTCPLLHFGLNSGIPVIAARCDQWFSQIHKHGHVCGYKYNETNYVHSKEVAFLACAEL